MDAPTPPAEPAGPPHPDDLDDLRDLEEPTAADHDPPDVATGILTALADVVASDRSAVLLDADGRVVPIALRGADRAPWGDPHRPESVLHRTWTQRVVGSGRVEEGAGHREVLVVPLLTAERGLLGVVVADRAGPAYGALEVQAAGGVARRAEPALRLAVLVWRHREEARLAERARLQRWLHDGLAQELAALGYQADATRGLVRRGDPTAAAAVDALHQAVRAVVGEVRTQLSQLAPPHHGQSSLAGLLEEQVQAVGSAIGARVRVDLREGPLTFLDRSQVALRAVVTAVLRDAQKAGDVTRIEVSGVLDAPYAALDLTHDGTTTLESGTFRGSALANLGADVRVDAVGQSHPVVTVRLPGTTPVAGSVRTGEGA